MDRLSPADATVLEASAGAVHGHVGQLIVLEPSGDRLDLAALRSWYAARLSRARAFRRRLVRVPLDLHRPLWADDPAFDLDTHVRSLEVTPGDDEGLDAAVGRLLGLPLDLERPPWEVWLLEGLDDGRVAVLTKQHLVTADDRRGDRMALAALEVVGEAPPRVKEAPWSPPPLPSAGQRLVRATVSRVRHPLGLARGLTPSLGRRPVRAGPAPARVFPGPLTSRRQVSRTTLALREVKAVKDHHDVSVNDVVLAVCAGGLRRLLETAGALPADPLVALVPVSVAPGAPGADGGEHVSGVVSSLGTDVSDPSLRIQVIQDATREARRRRAISARKLRDWSDHAAPAVLGQAGRVASRVTAAGAGPVCDLIVANIPGPTDDLATAGHPVRDLCLLGPVIEGVPLDVTVVSYRDRMEVGLVGCPDVGPDVVRLAAHLDEAMAELLATVPGERPGTGAAEVGVTGPDAGREA